MAGESLTFANSENPATWQNILGGIARDFGQIAVSNLTKDEDKIRATQQAPVAGAELRQWIPWIIGGVVLIVAAVFISKK